MLGLEVHFGVLRADFRTGQTHFLQTMCAVPTLYIASVRSLSMMLLSPRAPVPFLRASVAIAWRASGVTSNSASFMLNSREYCLIRAFLGSCMTCISSDSFNSWSVTITGKRPVNSGMRPYDIKSLCSTSNGPKAGRDGAVLEPAAGVSFSRIGASNPIEDSWRRSRTCNPKQQECVSCAIPHVCPSVHVTADPGSHLPLKVDECSSTDE